MKILIEFMSQLIINYLLTPRNLELLLTVVAVVVVVVWSTCNCCSWLLLETAEGSRRLLLTHTVSILPPLAMHRRHLPGLITSENAFVFHSDLFTVRSVFKKEPARPYLYRGGGSPWIGKCIMYCSPRNCWLIVKVMIFIWMIQWNKPSCEFFVWF